MNKVRKPNISDRISCLPDEIWICPRMKHDCNSTIPRCAILFSDTRYAVTPAIGVQTLIAQQYLTAVSCVPRNSTPVKAETVKHALTATLKCGVRVRKMCLRPQDSISNLASDSEMLFILFYFGLWQLLFCLFPIVFLVDTRNGGRIRSARSADNSHLLIAHMVSSIPVIGLPLHISPTYLHLVDYDAVYTI
jgi:hypothetical protein